MARLWGLQRDEEDEEGNVGELVFSLWRLNVRRTGSSGGKTAQCLGS